MNAATTAATPAIAATIQPHGAEDDPESAGAALAPGVGPPAAGAPAVPPHPATPNTTQTTAKAPEATASTRILVLGSSS
jgi:hypothetical protein